MILVTGISQSPISLPNYKLYCIRLVKEKLHKPGLSLIHKESYRIQSAVQSTCYFRHIFHCSFHQ